MEKPNFNYINALCAGDTSFREQLIGIIKKELPREISHYQSELRGENTSKIAECVHKLKHKISILGMEENYTVAESFEENLKKGSMDGKKPFEDILRLMEDFVEEI